MRPSVRHRVPGPGAPGSIAGFVARYAPYGAIPGMWFAYIGGASPMIGALCGIGAVAGIIIPAGVVSQRSRQRK